MYGCNFATRQHWRNSEPLQSTADCSLTGVLTDHMFCVAAAAVSSGAAPAGMTLWTLGLGLAFATLFASV